MSTKYATTMLFIGACLALPATVFGQSKTDSAESQSVTVTWTKTGSDGVASAEGCNQCPLQVTVDNKTKFLSKGKNISVKKANALSGQPGTIIYDVAEKRALKVVW